MRFLFYFLPVETLLMGGQVGFRKKERQGEQYLVLPKDDDACVATFAHAKLHAWVRGTISMSI